MEFLLKEYYFKDISQKQLSQFKSIFSKSKILSSKDITADFYVVFPKLLNGKLLFQLSQDGAKPNIFHENCDD